MAAHELLADLIAAGFDLTAQRGRLEVAPASRLTDPQRAAVRAHKSELLALVVDRVASEVHASRVARLVRWGWDRKDAAEVARRLALRDSTDDSRVACSECAHYRPSRCGNHRAAGLWAADVGRDLAVLLQHCPGFSAGVTDHPSANTQRPAPSLTAAGRHPPLNPPPGDRNA